MVSTQDTGTLLTTGFDAQRYEDLDRRFNAIVKRTQTTMMLERLWPRTVAPLCVGGAFVTTSWLGLWHALPPVGRMAGVAAFALAAAVTSAPLVLKKLRVTRAEAIARLDEENRDGRQPAFILNDRLPAGASAEAERVFAANRLRLLEEWVDQFSAGRRQSGKTFAPLAAAALAVAITAFTAGPHRLERLSEAFNWKTPPVPVLVKAWVTPPDNFRETALILDQNTKDAAHGGTKLEAHKSSKMTIVIFDRDTKVTVNGTAQTATKANVVKDPSQGKSTYQYELNLAEGRNSIVINNEVFWTINVAPDAAPTAAIKGIKQNEKDINAQELEYTEKDDYGIRDSELILTLPAAPAQGATPLPSTGRIAPMPLR
jgi:hypothetical protein